MFQKVIESLKSKIRLKQPVKQKVNNPIDLKKTLNTQHTINPFGTGNSSDLSDILVSLMDSGYLEEIINQNEKKYTNKYNKKDIYYIIYQQRMNEKEKAKDMNNILFRNIKNNIIEKLTNVFHPKRINYLIENPIEKTINNQVQILLSEENENDISFKIIELIQAYTKKGNHDDILVINHLISPYKAVKIDNYIEKHVHFKDNKDFYYTLQGKRISESEYNQYIEKRNVHENLSKNLLEKQHVKRMKI